MTRAAKAKKVAPRAVKAGPNTGETQERTCDGKGAKFDPAMLVAVFAPLTGRAISDEGRAVVARLHGMIEEWEFIRPSKARRYKRTTTSRQFDKAIGAFVADLLLARTHSKAQGWVYRSLKNKSFDHGPVTRTQGKAVVEGLRALELMDHVPGYTRYTAFGIERQVAPKLRARQELLALCEECGVVVESAAKHFTHGPPRDLVVVRGATTYKADGKHRGTLLKVDVPAQLRDEVQEINSFLDDHTLEHGTHRGFFRGYNMGDAEGFAFNKGGRLYSAGEDNYQNQELSDRLGMTIDGEPVAEVDVSASYLTILYAVHHLNFDGDPYVLPTLGAPARDAVKMFIAATIGAGVPPKKGWPRKQSRAFLETTGLRLQERWPFAEIKRLTLEAHPVLLRLQERVQGHVVGWADLMWVESQAIVRTVLDLKRNHNTPSFPVHDSLIVPMSKARLTQRQLEVHYYGELLGFYSQPTPPRLMVKVQAHTGS